MFHDYARMDSATHLSLLLAMFWLYLLALALLRFRKRGLWSLMGLPFAFYWPYFFWQMASNCAHNIRACP